MAKTAGGAGPSRTPSRRTRGPRAARPVAFSPASFLARIAIGKSSREYGPQEGIFWQGDRADAVFYLQKGSVELSVVSIRGKVAVVGVLGPRTFFGESCLAVQPLRSSTARAIQQSVIVRVDKAAMAALLHREAECARLFIAHLLARNVRVEADLIALLFNSSEKRLAQALLVLARFSKTSRSKEVRPRPSEGALASRVGTARSKVSSLMERFRKRGFIDYEGGGVKVHGSLLTVLLQD